MHQETCTYDVSQENFCRGCEYCLDNRCISVGAAFVGSGFGFANPSKGLVYNELSPTPSPPRPIRMPTPPNCTMPRCRICNYPRIDWQQQHSPAVSSAPPSSRPAAAATAVHLQIPHLFEAMSQVRAYVRKNHYIRTYVTEDKQDTHSHSTGSLQHALPPVD